VPSRRRSSATRPRSASSPTTKSGARKRPIRYLDELDIAYICHELAKTLSVKTFGAAMPAFAFDGNDGLDRLRSALHTPRQRWYGGVHRRAAAIFRSLVKNHALRDGNKRLACVALRVFLYINGVDFKVSDDNLARMAIGVAAFPGNVDLETIEKWVSAGCTGRPRSAVSVLAEQWPDLRRELTAAIRAADVAARRRARIPGRRVRPLKWRVP
jgi:death-on-curing protein